MAQNKPFEVTVRRSPLEKPLVETTEASTIEIRDSAGVLNALIVFIPGKPVFFASLADKDTDFEAFARNMGFKLTK